MAFLFEHTKLGFCWWDLLALVIFLAVLVIFIVKVHNQKKEENALEDQLKELTKTEDTNAEEALDSVQP